MNVTQANRNASAVEHLRAAAGKYLAFELDGEHYGIEILKVQEIISLMALTRMPRAPEYVRGIINLRGRIIPVVDLRIKFDFKSPDGRERGCIVVVDVSGREGTSVTIGILVDGVSEVLNVPEERLAPPPDFGPAVNTEFLRGVAKMDARVIILLDLDRVLAPEELIDVVHSAEEG